MPSLPRPVRNNNPLDIETGAPWLGLMPKEQMSAEQLAEPRFAIFKSKAWGFRAGAVLLRNYQHVHDINTLEGLVSRLAPRAENETETYIASMVKLTGIPREVVLNLENQQTLGTLLKGFASVEAGDFDQYYTDSQIDTALAMLIGAEA